MTRYNRLLAESNWFVGTSDQTSSYDECFQLLLEASHGRQSHFPAPRPRFVLLDHGGSLKKYTAGAHENDFTAHGYWRPATGRGRRTRSGGWCSQRTRAGATSYRRRGRRHRCEAGAGMKSHCRRACVGWYRTESGTWLLLLLPPYVGGVGGGGVRWGLWNCLCGRSSEHHAYPLRSQDIYTIDSERIAERIILNRLSLYTRKFSTGTMWAPSHSRMNY